MRTGRLLLLLFIAWAASWSTPACAEQRSTLLVTRAEAVSAMRPAFELPPRHLEFSEAASEPLSEDSGRASAKITCLAPPADSRASSDRLRTAPFLSSDLLLLIQRQNE